MPIDPALPSDIVTGRKGWVNTAKNLALWALAAAFVTASFSNSFFEIFSGIFLVLCLALIAAERRLDFFKSPFGVAAGIYLLWVLLTLTQSEYFAESLKGFFRVLRYTLMSFFVIYLVDNEKKFKKVFYVFALSVLAVGVDAIVQGIFGVEFLRNRAMTRFLRDTGRLTGPFSHANDFAAYLSLTIFLFLGMIRYAFRSVLWKERLFYLAGALLLGFCLLWTYSRGAWLAVALVCAVMAVLLRSRPIILALVASLLLIFFLSPASMKDRLTSFGGPNDGTMAERRHLWVEAIQMAQERPWLGQGINTYAKVEPRFKSKSFYTDKQYAHNGYLQIAAETGWIGLGAFMAVIVCFFAATLGWHLKRREEFLSAGALSLLWGVLSFLIHSATDTDLQSMRLVSLLWLAMGLVLAAKKISEPRTR